MLGSLIDRKIYKAIEKVLYHYFDIKHRLAEKEEEIINTRGNEIKINVRSNGYYSDPTAITAVKLCDEELEIMRKWIKIIDITKDRYKNTDKSRLLEMRYFEKLAPNDICERLYIERRTFYYWKNEIVIYISNLAAKYGLYDPVTNTIEIQNIF